MTDEAKQAPEPVCEELGYGNSKHTCENLYNCCDCGNREDGCGCAYCWSCRACDNCYGDAE